MVMAIRRSNRGYRRDAVLYQAPKRSGLHLLPSIRELVATIAFPAPDETHAPLDLTLSCEPGEKGAASPRAHLRTPRTGIGLHTLYAISIAATLTAPLTQLVVLVLPPNPIAIRDFARNRQTLCQYAPADRFQNRA